MKQTISNYIWTVILIIVLLINIAFATPFAKFVGQGIMDATESLSTAIAFNFNDGYKEITQEEGWTFEVSGVTAPINDSCTTITYSQFMSQYMDEEVEDDDEGANDEFAIGITLTEYTGDKKHIIVPNMYKQGDITYVVTAVGKPITEEPLNTKNIFNDRTNDISSVVVASGIDINPYAFHDCKKLKTVILVNTGVIGDYAFSTCQNLSKLDIGENTSTIGDFAFANCQSLAEIKFGENLLSIGNSAFYNDTHITSVTFPQTLSAIGNSAFRDCSALVYANIADTTLTIIGDQAFYNCKKLKGSLSLPDELRSIGKSAFEGCSALSGILNLPDEIVYIDDAAFKQCQFTKTDFSKLNSLVYIGNDAFYQCSKMSFIFVAPGTLKYIGENAFNGCSQCIDVLLNEGLQGIGTNAFLSVTKQYQSSLIMPSTCTMIGGRASIDEDFVPSFNYNKGTFTIGNTNAYILLNDSLEIVGDSVTSL